ncbi:hypothetical protein G3H63_09195 [Microbacterium resistens]|uniref:hypothetical protein n=1 Tax=Microbacterium resistens TaxID=156977 RepID=UPI001C55D6FF|nr:hypothetical protein [Microbacterium resistens]MBW1639245.1 hypothetical protein [Microbacterium resistens]
MRRLVAPAALAAVLAFAGCSAPEEPASSPSTAIEPVAAPIEEPGDAESVEEIVTYVLAQDHGTMTSNEILNSAQKLRTLAEEEYSASKLGTIPVELLAIATEAINETPTEPVPALQTQLAELAKQVQEL